MYSSCRKVLFKISSCEEITFKKHQRELLNGLKLGGDTDTMSLKLNSKDRPKSSTSAVPSEDSEGCYKLVMIGDSGVGKSCLLDKFLDDSSSNNFISTIGVDIRTREAVINNKKVKVQVSAAN